MNTKTTKGKLSKNVLRENAELWLLALPGFLLTFLFCYIPMFGIIIAFKKFNPNLGILASKWIGFDNFKFFFASNDFFRIMRNTIGYGVVFLFLGNFLAIGLAILLYNVYNRAALKYYQTTMVFPNFMSMVLVAFIVYAFLNPVSGIVNRLFGLDVEWYAESKYWPFILTLVEMWKGIGMKSIIYYAALMGIDESLFEAARIDGARKKDEIKYIIIPEIMSLLCIYLVLGVGGLVNGDFGLFYQIPMNVGKLYSTTDIINTYVFRALQQATNMGRTAAVGLFQSATGMILVVLANLVVRKIDAEKSLF